jgi:ABC-2 type transport system permease protein
MAERKEYSQVTAMLAITKASLRSIFRSPSAVVFSFAFPLIFIVVFGFIGNSGFKLDVAIEKQTDTTNLLYKNIVNNPAFNIIRDESDEEMLHDLNKGRIDGILNIQPNMPGSGSFLMVNVKTSASSQNTSILLNTLQSIIDKGTLTMLLNQNPATAKIAEIKEDRQPGREYKSIDFILPGMLGFSLLSTGVFGTAFTFLSLRQTLVIKRFFATPIKRPYIVLGEGISRVLFALITSSVILVLGYFAFGFTLVHGLITFINLLILSFIGLFVFMGFGFVVSGLAKNESAVPPIANLITLPQFLLAGTFFSSEAFPSWLQPVTKILPLTYLNDAMRKVAFEGAGLFDVWKDMLVMGICAVIVYFIAIKVFRWE